MSIDTENAEREESSGSSRTRRRQGKPDKSTSDLRRNSKRGQGADAGKSAETKLTSLDVLLTMLQSHLGEIRDFGGCVRVVEESNGLIIQLPNVAICHSHKMMHSGQRCPMC